MQHQDDDVVTVLPSHVKGILDCSRFLIQKLQRQASSNEELTTATATATATTTSVADVEQDMMEDAIDDGFMCIDLHVVKTKLLKWQRLFPQVIPYFAMKCNPDPMVLQWLLKAAAAANNDDDNDNVNVGFDVASLTELQLAMKYCCTSSGANNDNNNNSKNRQRKRRQLPRWIYANPQRAEQDLMECLKLYSDHEISNKNNNNDDDSSSSLLFLTVDGIEELHKIAKLCATTSCNNTFPLLQRRIGLIVRILVPDHHSNVPLGEKFGIALNDIEPLIQEGMVHLNFQPSNFIGVSFHCGSGCHDPETYLSALQMTRQALDIIHTAVLKYSNDDIDIADTDVIDDNDNIQQQQQHNKCCWLIDIGGGFPGWDGIGGDCNRFSSLQQQQQQQQQTSTTTSSNNDNDNPDITTKSETTTTTTTETTTQAIAAAIQPSLQQFVKEGYQIISEPGRFFVEAAIFLASRIYHKKCITVPTTSTITTSTGGDGGGDESTTPNGSFQANAIREYKIAHGVHGVFKDVLLCGETFVPLPLRMVPPDNDDDDNDNHRQDDDNAILYDSRIRGPTASLGDEQKGQQQDVVCSHCRLPDLKVGDWVIFDRMGAYTVSIASRTGRPVMCYVEGGKGEGGDSISSFIQ